MSIYRELEYNNEISQVNGIRFTILSPDEIKRMSVCEITKTDTYIGSEPVPNGLFDARTGTIEPNKICPTCEAKSNFCSGHMSYISLAKPVFYIQFFDIIKKILRCVCFRCSKLLINPESNIMKAILSKKLSRQKRWELVYKLCMKIKRCGQETLDGCNAKQPDKIYRDTIVKVVMEWKEIMVADDVKKQVFRAEEILRILQRISNKDCEVLGFNHHYNRPEWMICTVFPVPPPSVRPSVRSDTGQRSEDDLTHKLCDIVKSNNALKSRIEKGASKEQIDIGTQVLQYHVATFIDNKIPGINPAQQRTGRLLKSLTERLKSKEGRIRGNLMGKRVDFSARSVITPDPNISIDELGVPIKIAMNLTFPVVVNKYNHDQLMEYVRNGPDKYPGAKFIRKNNTTYSLKNISKDTIVLEEGNIVDRHLINGDPVLFNRQPSLHRSSMLCHRVRVMPFNTFRLNVCVCAGYNADFDGDEMNMHIPQSTLTAVELQELASVNTQIISPRECKPIISVVQDIALGIYRITNKDVTLSAKQMMNLMSTNSKFNGTIPAPHFDNLKGIQKWTGRQVLSSIIPKNITLKRPNKNFDDKKVNDDDNFVKIENGEIIQGTLDKTIYQDRTTGLVHAIVNECNNEEVRMFFDNTQKIICDWLVTSGFSVGISDLIIDADTTSKIRNIIREMKVNVYDTIKNIHEGKFENNSLNKNNDFFEGKVNNMLNSTRNSVGELALQKISDSNRMMNMVKSGSKGSILNVSQMVGCLGQQNVDGKRIAYGFDERTLPHYIKFDDGPDSHGFVESSFITGLSPQEFFFHAMGGREGLIDTAVKTSETGYLQRKLVKAMEDCKINYDYTVRNASGSIVQFLYGDDGIDPIKIESQKLTYIDSDYSKLSKEYLWTEADDLKYIFDENVIANITKTKKELYGRLRKHFDQVFEDREFMITKIFKRKQDSVIFYPISFMRIITNARAMFTAHDGILSDLDPTYVLDQIEKLGSELFFNSLNKGNKLLNILIRCYLSPKKVCYEYKFNQMTFDFVIQTVRMRFYDSIANPSEMIGVVAAQSIGEPTTQLTLNTFHSSGISSASKTVRGVPRIKELLSVTKNIKSPSMTIFIKEEFNQDKKICTDILKSIQTTYFKDIVNSTKIYFDPDDFNTTIENDREFVKSYKDFMQNDDTTSMSPWLLRMEFDRDKLHEQNISMNDIHFVLNNFYEDLITAMFSDDNFDNLICRIKLNEIPNDERDIITELKALEKSILENLVVKGVKKVSKVHMMKNEFPRYNDASMQFEKHFEWVLDTSGTNLLDIMCHNQIDASRTISNDVNEIYEVLGIEAARQILFTELSDTLAELYVNYRHIALLVDTMTNKGYLLSIDRHGINRVDIGPLAKCSFEETTDMLIKAGIFSEIDKINGVSANIMLGQIPPSGTGDTDIILDEWKINELDKVIRKHDDEEEELTKDDDVINIRDNSEVCSRLGFDFVLPEKDINIADKKMNIEINIV
jgi:DNA-directed RNA polymerase II subunit RPB1